MNGWNSYIDIYCERLEPGLWAEPLNAVSNSAFLIAALIVALGLRGPGNLEARVLTAILAAIGVGSFLFHTFATRWAAMADVLPIAAFVLYFLYLVNRHLLNFGAPFAPCWPPCCSSRTRLSQHLRSVPCFRGSAAPPRTDRLRS